jgi:cell division protein FtsQ
MSAGVVRGGSRTASKSRPKARGAARAGPYTPAKLRAAQGIGLRPGTALAMAGGVAAVGLLFALGTGGRFASVAQTVGHGVALKLARLGFRIEAVHVEGASPQAQADILRASALKPGAPILDEDLGALRQRVAGVGWVKSVRIVRLLPDTLVISISERSPMAVWQFHGRARVIDDGGHLIGEADPGRFPDLPLVVGGGANQEAREVLSLLRSRPRVMERLEALVRVDDRRWDIRMKDGGLIQLPAQGVESALIQLDQLDQKARILELGFARIDLRDPEMVAVRPRDGAPASQATPATAGA